MLITNRLKWGIYGHFKRPLHLIKIKHKMLITSTKCYYVDFKCRTNLSSIQIDSQKLKTVIAIFIKTTFINYINVYFCNWLLRCPIFLGNPFCFYTRSIEKVKSGLVNYVCVTVRLSSAQCYIVQTNLPILTKFGKWIYFGHITRLFPF